MPAETDLTTLERDISDPLVDLLVGPRVEIFRRAWRRGLARADSSAALRPGTVGFGISWWALFLYPLWPAYRSCWPLLWINIGAFLGIAGLTLVTEINLSYAHFGLAAWNSLSAHGFYLAHVRRQLAAARTASDPEAAARESGHKWTLGVLQSLLALGALVIGVVIVITVLVLAGFGTAAVESGA